MHIRIYTCQLQEEMGTADGYVEIRDCTVWTDTAKFEERIYKEK